MNCNYQKLTTQNLHYLLKLYLLIKLKVPTQTSEYKINHIDKGSANNGLYFDQYYSQKYDFKITIVESSIMRQNYPHY